MSSDDVGTVLNIAADLFAQTPRDNFTREDVVRWLRVLPDEIAHTLLQMELEHDLAAMEHAECLPS